MRSEKVTFNISSELKHKMIELKKESNLSLSTLYNEAIENYIQQKEVEKWQKGAMLASKDKEYIKFIEEVSSDDGGVYEYESK